MREIIKIDYLPATHNLALVLSKIPEGDVSVTPITTKAPRNLEDFDFAIYGTTIPQDWYWINREIFGAIVFKIGFHCRRGSKFIVEYTPARKH